MIKKVILKYDKETRDMISQLINDQKRNRQIILRKKSRAEALL